MAQRQNYNGLVDRHDKIVDPNREARLAAHSARIEKEMAAAAKAEAKKAKKASGRSGIHTSDVHLPARSRERADTVPGV